MTLKAHGHVVKIQEKQNGMARKNKTENEMDDISLGSDDSLLTEEEEGNSQEDASLTNIEETGEEPSIESKDQALSNVKQRKVSLLPRLPRAKLDASRILGENGFSVIMKRGSKLKFKGKGHEAEDLKRLVAFYRDWAHGLFPKYPFKDVIKTIEKQCHTRQMNVYMEQWFMDWKRGTPISELVMPLSSAMASTTEPPLTDATAIALGPIEAALLAQAQMQSMDEGDLHQEALTFALSRDQLNVIEERKALALEKLAKKKSLKLQDDLPPPPPVDAQLTEFLSQLNDSDMRALNDEFC